MTKAGRRQVRFAVSTCRACPLASQCTERASGQRHDVNPDEALLAPACKARWTEGFHQPGPRPRARTLSSSTVTPRLPRPGRAKADAWLKLRLAALNLDHLGKMSGLIR